MSQACVSPVEDERDGFLMQPGARGKEGAGLTYPVMEEQCLWTRSGVGVSLFLLLSEAPEEC